MTSFSWRDVLIDAYVKSATMKFQSYIPNELTARFMFVLWITHTILIWRVSVFVATKWPDAVSAARSLILSACFVFVVWVVYLF